MTDLLKADKGQNATTIHLVDETSFADWRKGQSGAIRTLLDARRYDGKRIDANMILPGKNEDDWSVIHSVAKVDALTPWCLASLAAALPKGTYRLADDRHPGPAKLGWLLAQHRFDTYRTTPEEPTGPRILLASDVADMERTARLAGATALVRDLINTPAEDMGPAEIEKAVRTLGEKHDAKVHVTKGDSLEQGYPMIHAVGRAAARGREPRLIELEWGRKDAPRIAIVGKGVVFDTGGLSMKNGAGMALMKKDMGGAAHAIALARLVMEARLPVRLHLLVPSVENSVDARSIRPSDVIRSRKGLTVEVDNTDAEGRLILGDALTKAGEGEPELIIDYATLTGAARVALGPDLPPMFANDDDLAKALEAGAAQEADPIWRMPLWAEYNSMHKSTIADMLNSGGSSFAGCITAALFLQRFVPKEIPWAHFDTFGWMPSDKSGRPKGGEAYGLRCAFAMLESRFSAN